MNRLLFYFGLLLAAAAPAAAQTVSTPALTYPAGVLPAGDALSADAAGNLYVSDFAGTGTGTNGNGRNVLQIAPSGAVTVFVALPAGSGPAGSVFDRAGNFYVSAYNTGIVYRRTPQGVVSPFASGLNAPTGLAFDASENLYVTITGNTTPGTTVLRITPTGQQSTFATGLFYPGGLAFDGSGNLYVSNFVDGQIKRVSPAGVVSNFITISGGGFVPPLGYLVVVGTTLYATNIGGNRLYRITLPGTPTATVLAGDGTAGSQDGPAATARFDGPNGLVAADNGASLYVSETTASPRRLRRIGGLPLATGAATPPPGRDGLRLGTYPNPATTEALVSYVLPAPAAVRVEVRTAAGQVVATLAQSQQGPGAHLLRIPTSGLAAGCYFLTLSTPELAQTSKLVVLH